MPTILSAIAGVCAAVGIAVPLFAAEPAAFRANGLELGMTPAAVARVLERDYPPCAPDRSNYHITDSDPALKVAALSINPGLAANDLGTADFCSFSPAGDGATDSIEARFVHPDVDPTQPLYALVYKRLYPDMVFGGASVQKAFDTLRAELIKSYGRPADERRDTIVSAAANLARSVGIGNKVKREDQRIRYLWTAGGRLDDQERDDSTCQCSGRYVKAVIEISRSVSAKRRQPFSVLSVAVTMADPALAARQDRWNAQWQRERK